MGKSAAVLCEEIVTGYGWLTSMYPVRLPFDVDQMDFDYTISQVEASAFLKIIISILL